MTLPNHQHTLWIKLPLWVTSTLTNIWAEVTTVRSASNIDLLAVPLSCYGSSSGRKIYNALRATKRELFEAEPSIIDEINNGIAWARGIHCGHPLPDVEIDFPTANLLMQTNNELLRRIAIFRYINSDCPAIEIAIAYATAVQINRPTDRLNTVKDLLSSSTQYLNTRN